VQEPEFGDNFQHFSWQTLDYLKSRLGLSSIPHTTGQTEQSSADRCVGS
jgi:hypothetical protein